MLSPSSLLLLLLLISLLPSVHSFDPSLYKDTPLSDLQSALAKDPSSLNAQHPTSKQTPLMAATLAGRTEAASYFLKAGADVSIAEKDGYTPPHGAGFQGRPSIMALLIASGVDVNEYHEDGFSPLHRACWGKTLGHAETVAVLLSHGVDAEERGRGEGSGKSCEEMTGNEMTRDVLEKYKRRGDEKVEL